MPVHTVRVSDARGSIAPSRCRPRQRGDPPGNLRRIPIFEPPLARDILPPEQPDAPLDIALRPKRLDDFVGQPAVVDNLRVAVAAARMRSEPLDHTLLSGLPGLGKTTLAELLARELGVNMKTTAGPVIERAADLAGLLTALKRGDVLFIDEIHRMPASVEEYLYSAMEDFVLDIVVDQGARARSVRVQIEPFTLVGATTREGLLTAPFRGRFGMIERLEPYQVDDLVTIARRSAQLLNIGLDDAAARLVADRARGTPRLVNRFLRRLRDLAQVERHAGIDGDLAARGLARLGIDARGLMAIDRRLLEILHRAGGEPVGLKTLAASVGDDERTIEDVYEPFLIREGFVLKTPRGRQITPHGAAAIGLAPPPPAPGAATPGTLFGDE